jgi:hypothetical protein
MSAATYLFSPPRPASGRGGWGVRGFTQRISSQKSSSRSAPPTPPLHPRGGCGGWGLWGLRESSFVAASAPSSPALLPRGGEGSQSALRMGVAL